MARPTKEEARDTRRLILDAALDLFSEGGFAGTSMRQIARAVGVRESALYHHFPSKAAIFEAMLQEMGPGKAERLEALDLDAVVAGGLEHFLGFLAHGMVEEWATPREQKFVRLMLAEAPRWKEAGLIQGSVLSGRKRLGQLFEALARRGAIRPGDSELYAMEFVGPMLMLRLVHLVMAEGAPDLERLHARVEAHVRHFCESVKAGEAMTLKSVSRRRP
ncbi:MAG: TetR/AcrR family transcriptional regulator [Archangium sp.]